MLSSGKLYRKVETALIRTFAEVEVQSKTNVGLQWLGRVIDYNTWLKVVAFMRESQKRIKSEALCWLYYNPQDQQWLMFVPPQISRGMTVKSNHQHPEFNTMRAQIPAGFVQAGSVHHHCTGGAFQSGTDRNDEENFDGIHITLGNMESDTMSFHGRFIYNNSQFTAALADWVQMPPFIEQLPTKMRHKVFDELLLNLWPSIQEAGVDEAWFNRIDHTSSMPGGTVYTVPTYSAGTNFQHPVASLWQGSDANQPPDFYLDRDLDLWMKVEANQVGSDNTVLKGRYALLRDARLQSFFKLQPEVEKWVQSVRTDKKKEQASQAQKSTSSSTTAVTQPSTLLTDSEMQDALISFYNDVDTAFGGRDFVQVFNTNPHRTIRAHSSLKKNAAEFVKKWFLKSYPKDYSSVKILVSSPGAEELFFAENNKSRRIITAPSAVSECLADMMAAIMDDWEVPAYLDLLQKWNKAISANWKEKNGPERMGEQFFFRCQQMLPEDDSPEFLELLFLYTLFMELLSQNREFMALQDLPALFTHCMFAAQDARGLFWLEHYDTANAKDINDANEEFSDFLYTMGDHFENPEEVRVCEETEKKPDQTANPA